MSWHIPETQRRRSGVKQDASDNRLHLSNRRKQCLLACETGEKACLGKADNLSNQTAADPHAVGAAYRLAADLRAGSRETAAPKVLVVVRRIIHLLTLMRKASSLPMPMRPCGLHATPGQRHSISVARPVCEALRLNIYPPKIMKWWWRIASSACAHARAISLPCATCGLVIYRCVAETHPGSQWW
jgi:hypothetical protein